MKILILFATLLVAIHAMTIPKKVFQSKIIRTPSLKNKMIKDGTWATNKNRFKKNRVLASGNSTVIDYQDTTYLINITLGTPPQTMMVIPDTGSSGLWVYMCFNYNHSCFNQSLSSTFQDDGLPFVIDLFNVSGLTYKTQKFGLAIYNSVNDSPGYCGGVLGLGWPSLATANVTPPLQNLLPLLDKPLFSVWFDRIIHPSQGGNVGIITFGAIDTKNCDSNINYVKLTSLSYWQFSLSSISVGSFSNKKPAQAISETAYPWIYGPKADVNAIISVMNAHFDDINYIYVIPCNRTGLPDWVFTIGGYQYNIPSNEYVIDLALGNGNCAVTINWHDSAGFGQSWVLGDTFIRTYCNFYDIGNQQIGFSKAHHTSV